MNKENQGFSKLSKITKESKKFSNLNKLSKKNKEKSFDAIKFKRKLQENVWKHSEAKNSKEYMEYANKNARKSILYRAGKSKQP